MAGEKCRSRARFGRCDLGRHAGNIHAVYIGTGDCWFVYEVKGGHARAVDKGYRVGRPAI